MNTVNDQTNELEWFRKTSAYQFVDPQSGESSTELGRILTVVDSLNADGSRME